jgi:hypothetical protein
MRQDGYFVDIKWTDKEGKTGVHAKSVPVHSADKIVFEMNAKQEEKTYWVHVIPGSGKHGFGD